MYHSPSRFRLIATRVLVYLLMTVTVLVVVTLAIFYILGYRFDNESHRIEQNGLVQYISKPSGATIAIDGVTLSPRTPTNSTVSSGIHTFNFTRDGYVSWQKTIDIYPGVLTWLNYARLIPNNLNVESVATLPRAAQAIVSPNRHFMAIMPRSDKPSVDVYDLTSDSVRTIALSMSTDQYDATKVSGMKHVFKLVEWDDNGRYLLMKHTHGKAVEWLVFDRQTGKLLSNVTKTMDVAIKSAHIVDRGGPNLIALIDDDIRKINLDRETVSRPIVSHADNFSVYSSDVITYVARADEMTGQRQVGVVAGNGTPSVVYTTSSKSTQPLRAVSGHYFDKDYIAVSDGFKVTLFSGAFPQAQSESGAMLSETILTSVKNVTWLQFSPESRFVVAQTGNQFQTYDIERKELSGVLALGSSKNPERLRWLDNYYVWSDHNATLKIEEFDGANPHDINKVAPGFDAAISPDGKYIYSLGKTSKGFQLQRVQLFS